MKPGRDILSEYGKDISHPQAPRATSGGCTSARDVMNYKPPVGPMHQHSERPGLPGGTNHGNAACPVATRGSGGVGSGGNRGGSQRG